MRLMEKKNAIWRLLGENPQTYAQLHKQFGRNGASYKFILQDLEKKKLIAGFDVNGVIYVCRLDKVREFSTDEKQNI